MEQTLLANRYRLERQLARGGMGAVYLAWDQKFDRPVALKVAEPGAMNVEHFKARFRREARIGDFLGRSPGFVRALDWGELPGSRLYLAMDLVPYARTLDLCSGGIHERLARLAGAAELVARAHARGVIHRDLKPANFLVGTDGSVFLADFGLAKRVGEDQSDDPLVSSTFTTRTGIGFGTPDFMAPEQFEDAKTADMRADVYSLGVMLFFALTGDLPFKGKAPSEIMRVQMM